MKKLSSLAALASLSILGGFAVGCSAANEEEVSVGDAHVESGVLVYQHDAPVTLETVSAREADRLLVKVFESGYRSSVDDCEKDLPDPRIVPGVNGKISGSFTGIGKRETLYIISVWGCDASHAEGYGTSRFVVTEPISATGATVKVLANAEVQGAGASINRLVDVDRDGQLELVMTSGYMGQGITMEAADVVRFAGNNLAKDETFTAFRESLYAEVDAESPFFTDTCDSGLADLSIRFATVYATTQDGKLAFTAQRGTRACPPSATK